ncbi:MAG: hypothetical protein ACE5FW_02650, partial [Candidatus Aenigmatarchaeota archaeon]
MNIDFSGVEAGKKYTRKNLKERGIYGPMASALIKSGPLVADEYGKVTGESLLALRELLDSTISTEEAIEMIGSDERVRYLELSETEIRSCVRERVPPVKRMPTGNRYRESDAPKMVEYALKKYEGSIKGSRKRKADEIKRRLKKKIPELERREREVFGEPDLLSLTNLTKTIKLEKLRMLDNYIEGRKDLLDGLEE